MCTGGKSVQVRVSGAWLKLIKLYDARSICAIEQVEGEEEEGEESSELDSSGDEHPAKEEERSKVVIASRE